MLVLLLIIKVVVVGIPTKSNLLFEKGILLVMVGNHFDVSESVFDGRGVVVSNLEDL